ncbi:MAG: hypothetical protein AAGH42_05850 [Pseudomonadota bacterium]
MRESEDGFRLAGEDLCLRDAGNLLDTAQSGFPRFAIADTNTHSNLLLAAGDGAKLISERDPTLASVSCNALLNLL